MYVYVFQVEVEITLGSLTLFLSPRQLHVLLELAHGLASPDLEDVSNVVPRTYTGKPIAGSDFSRIEHELIQHTYPAPDLRTTVTNIYGHFNFFLLVYLFIATNIFCVS